MGTVSSAIIAKCPWGPAAERALFWTLLCSDQCLKHKGPQRPRGIIIPLVCADVARSPEVSPPLLRGPLPWVSPADLLEDVVSADVLDVLLDHRADAVLLCELLLQPLHQILVVVPNIGLRTDDAWSDARGLPRPDTLTVLHLGGPLQKCPQHKETRPVPP